LLVRAIDRYAGAAPAANATIAPRLRALNSMQAPECVRHHNLSLAMPDINEPEKEPEPATVGY